MKKVILFSAAVLLSGVVSVKAQDTLLYESFQFVMDSYLQEIVSPPPAVTVDSDWYNFDRDQKNDMNGRPGGWFQTVAVADADTFDLFTMDTNVVMASSSWFDSPELADNWLITQNIQLGDHDTLFWRSAPRQTPRYLDGYEVLLSTTTNDDLAFTHVLFTAAEMTDLSTVAGDSTNFDNFEFSTGFVHGQDSTYIEQEAPGSAYKGQLRPFWVALDNYANQNVFIAFHHNSYDDNLITIDDILVRGTASNPFAGIKEKSNADLGLNVFPNPASESVQVNFTLASQSTVAVTVSDVTGKVVYSENKGSMSQGRQFAVINTADLAKGFYTVAVQTQYGRNTTKLIVK